MKNSNLTLKEVKFWAGFIPAKLCFLISITILALMGFIPLSYRLSIETGRLVGLLCILVIAGSTILVWKWGSKRQVYQFQYLKEVIESEQRMLTSLHHESEEMRLWRTRRIKEAQDYLHQIHEGVIIG